jgi:GntR family transcriptional regulator
LHVSSHEPSSLAQRLTLYLDPSDDAPLHRQIVDRVWLEVVTGTLETGERLPTVRQLAIDLSVHPNTVQHAYEELETLGVLVTRQGEGTYIGLALPDKGTLERRAQLERLCGDVAAQCRALGLSIDDVIDTLGALQTSERERDPKRGNHG